MKNFMDMLGFTHKPLLNFSLEANERVSTWQAKAAPTVTEQLGLSGDGSLVVYCLLACLFKGWGGSTCGLRVSSGKSEGDGI